MSVPDDWDGAQPIWPTAKPHAPIPPMTAREFETIREKWDHLFRERYMDRVIIKGDERAALSKDFDLLLSIADAHRRQCEEIARKNAALRAAKVALPVLKTMCRRAGLSGGEAKAAEMIGWIDEALSAQDEGGGGGK